MNVEHLRNEKERKLTLKKHISRQPLNSTALTLPRSSPQYSTPCVKSFWLYLQIINNLLLQSVDSGKRPKIYLKEHWIQRITFAAETNAASSRGSADTDTHTHAERQNTFK